jgi:hypothetical protein
LVEEIVWPEKPPLRDIANWEASVRLVHLLCELGTVTKWQDGVEGRDTYVHMPYHYDIDGAEVCFLPHWGYIEVEGFPFDLPTNRNELLRSIALVKTKQELDKMFEATGVKSPL